VQTAKCKRFEGTTCAGVPAIDEGNQTCGPPELGGRCVFGTWFETEPCVDDLTPVRPPSPPTVLSSALLRGDVCLKCLRCASPSCPPLLRQNLFDPLRHVESLSASARLDCVPSLIGAAHAQAGLAGRGLPGCRERARPGVGAVPERRLHGPHAVCPRLLHARRQRADAVVAAVPPRSCASPCPLHAPPR